MSDNDTDMPTGCLQAAREAVEKGLERTSAPMAGVFRRRSKQAVYGQMTTDIMAELEPVVRMAVSYVPEDGREDEDEAQPTENRSEASEKYFSDEDEVRMDTLRGLQTELNLLERTPRKALQIVEQHISSIQEARLQEQADG